MKRKILIADDNVDFVNTISARLENADGQKGDAVMEEKARKLGAREFLRKPYEPQQFLAVIKKILGE